MIKNQIKADLIKAMKEKNEVKKLSLKSVLAGFTNELVSLGKTPQDEVTDEIALSVIKKEVKKRKDAFEQFKNAGRNELAENESQEIEILEKYLPEMMNNDKLLNIAKSKKAELNIDDKSKMGILIGAVMKETAGNADGSDVKRIVESIL